MHSSRLIFAVVMLASASLAQTAHGVPSSVTSSGFGHGGSAPPATESAPAHLIAPITLHTMRIAATIMDTAGSMVFLTFTRM